MRGFGVSVPWGFIRGIVLQDEKTIQFNAYKMENGKKRLMGEFDNLKEAKVLLDPSFGL